ncbi:MAG TPA: quinoprotein dehydrogenase-associated putative ABC transporter substrate-binding protein [Gammaproteobacteria bacterium]|nr:quinoprotein dehydrogenase-associated putative ABC transporter substrate-binding protein [Gammaproteobacteria bacterium]
MITMRATAAFAAAVLAASAAPAGAQLAADTLTVCADPNNLPFSNRAEEGFENELARLWAREAGVALEYTWFPHRRGFERNTLNAEDLGSGGYKCDVIVGVPAGYDLALTTRPYYRSTYALVYVVGGKLDVKNALDLTALPPATRETLRIGVFTPGPAAEWLARHGLYDQMVPYPALGGDPDVYPGKIVENELLAGELDAAILFGPIAGYFAARAAPVEVAVVPLRSEPGIQFEFAMAAAVRFGDRARRAALEDLIARTAAQTEALLAEYHIPVVESPAERVYVTNEDGHSVSIISTATQSVLGEIAVGTRPRGVEVSDDGEELYVALSGSPKCPPTLPDDECAKLTSDKSKDGIAIVDVRRQAVLRVLPGGSDPEEFDVDLHARRLFVSNEDAGQLSIVDLASGDVVRSVAVGGEPEGVRLRPDRKTLYVTSESDHGVSVVDAQSGDVLGTIDVGWRPRDSIFSTDGSRAYVSAEHGGSVAVVDVASSEVVATIALPAGSLPMGLALSPDGALLYVANGRAGTVSVVDLAAARVVANVRVGARPWGIGLTSDGKFLYTANGPSNDVSVIDTASLNVVATIRVGKTPWGIAIGPSPREP